MEPLSAEAASLQRHAITVLSQTKLKWVSYKEHLRLQRVGAAQHYLFEKFGKHDRVLRLLSEAEVHSAEKMLEIEWATEIYSGTAEEGLAQFLEKMLKIHPSVHRAYKTIAIRKWTADFIKDRMMGEAQNCSILWESEAHHDAVKRFLQSNN